MGMKNPMNTNKLMISIVSIVVIVAMVTLTDGTTVIGMARPPPPQNNYPLQCGDSVYSSVTLDRDIVCYEPINALTIKNKDVTLDCAGHKIVGMVTDPQGRVGQDGIVVEGLTGVTIKNCEIYQFDFGVYFYKMGRSVIDNVNSHNNFDGFHILNSNTIKIINSRGNNNGRNGIVYETVRDVSVENTIFNSNKNGIALLDINKITIKNNQILGNTNFGVDAQTWIHLVVRGAYLENNRICNPGSDVYVGPYPERASVSGISNTCTRLVNYHDEGLPGCTNIC